MRISHINISYGVPLKNKKLVELLTIEEQKLKTSLSRLSVLDYIYTK